MQTIATRERHAESVRINDDLWRITGSDGFVYGHIERIATPQGDRYEAKRYTLVTARFTAIGRFWRFADAVDCLRWS